jgi:hypothetical protein
MVCSDLAGNSAEDSGLVKDENGSLLPYPSRLNQLPIPQHHNRTYILIPLPHAPPSGFTLVALTLLIILTSPARRDALPPCARDSPTG